MKFMTATGTTTLGSNWPIIKQLAIVFGYIMQGIFVVLSGMGIENIGICIIVFTIITKMLLLPLTIKQQKFSKLNSVMSPEVMAVQKKYKNKRDQQSASKMQMETQAIYDKYGASQTAGCLPSLIQLPIMFALIPIIYNLPSYIPQLAEYSEEQLTQVYTFIGINLQNSPGFKLSIALVIPILAGALQFISSKLLMANQPKMEEGTMANSMKYMNYMMPVMSIFFCVSFPAFIGLYWVVQSAVMIIQQLIINKYMERISIEDLIKQNIAKKNKKRAKKGLPPLNEKAAINTKKLQQNVNKGNQKSNLNKEDRDADIKASTEYYQNKEASGGGLASKANMVRDYNEKNKNKK